MKVSVQTSLGINRERNTKSDKVRQLELDDVKADLKAVE